MRGHDDEQALNDAYRHTIERYRLAFGDPPADTWISRCSDRFGGDGRPRFATKPR